MKLLFKMLSGTRDDDYASLDTVLEVRVEYFNPNVDECHMNKLESIKYRGAVRTKVREALTNLYKQLDEDMDGNAYCYHPTIEHIEGD